MWVRRSPSGLALASACGYMLVATATRTGMSRGHLATAVAASGECLAAAVSMSSAGAIAAGGVPWLEEVPEPRE